MNERAGRLRALVNGPAWRDLNGILSETVQALLQEALQAEKDEDAARLIQESRVAQKFAFKFTQLVENTAQQFGDE